jgi:hypothetical protein
LVTASIFSQPALPPFQTNMPFRDRGGAWIARTQFTLSRLIALTLEVEYEPVEKFSDDLQRFLKPADTVVVGKSRMRDTLVRTGLHQRALAGRTGRERQTAGRSTYRNRNGVRRNRRTTSDRGNATRTRYFIGTRR